MLYVLEGCDGCGKSTLAIFLSRLLNADIVHCSADTPNTLEFFKNLIYAAQDRNIIVDRYCYGQFVYQEENERPLATKERTALEGLQDLEYEMLDWGVKVIYVDAPNEVIEARLKARNEKLMNNLSIEDIKSNYNDIRKASMLTWLDYNTGGDIKCSI